MKRVRLAGCLIAALWFGLLTLGAIISMPSEPTSLDVAFDVVLGLILALPTLWFAKRAGKIYEGITAERKAVREIPLPPPLPPRRKH